METQNAIFIYLYSYISSATGVMHKLYVFSEEEYYFLKFRKCFRHRKAYFLSPEKERHDACYTRMKVQFIAILFSCSIELTGRLARGDDVPGGCCGSRRDFIGRVATQVASRRWLITTMRRNFEMGPSERCGCFICQGKRNDCVATL
ncbi:UNVERIFIED_CONTAM: hypothetical protein PYX00_010421 [Menopon gallinae]|uniref:Secreted protein n=1 Tax=Menopon gallinae TaxID=328185 RepID=A0AAW2HFF8_9NEOP